MRSVPIFVCLLGISLATALRIIPRSQKPDVTPEGFLKAGPGGIDAIEITPKNLLAGMSGNPKAPVLKHRAPDSASLVVKLINNLDRATVRAYISGLDATVLGMILTEKDGSTQTTAGLVADAVTKICNDLMKLRETDHRDWASLCIANAEGKTVRVLSPGNRHEVEAQLFNDYWDTYVNEVWKKYATQDLVIDTQSNVSQVKCRVSDNQLVCEGSDRGFAKPTSKDIWGCNSGPFAISEGDTSIHAAIVPRICAAFVRSTLLLDGGDIQPSLGQSSYYTVNPTNHYSRIVHSYEVDGRGYAFPYDDVNPDGNEDASGVVSSNNVQSLAIYVGAPPSLG